MSDWPTADGIVIDGFEALRLKSTHRFYGDCGTAEAEPCLKAKC
jgi:hypothetical protein